MASELEQHVVVGQLGRGLRVKAAGVKRGEQRAPTRQWAKGGRKCVERDFKAQAECAKLLQAGECSEALVADVCNIPGT